MILNSRLKMVMVRDLGLVNMKEFADLFRESNNFYIKGAFLIKAYAKENIVKKILYQRR